MKQNKISNEFNKKSVSPSLKKFLLFMAAFGPIFLFSMSPTLASDKTLTGEFLTPTDNNKSFLKATTPIKPKLEPAKITEELIDPDSILWISNMLMRHQITENLNIGGEAGATSEYDENEKEVVIDPNIGLGFKYE